MNQKSLHIPSLTGIRAIAAGIVFLGHMIHFHKEDTYPIMHYGWIGVNIFFALSGYLFTHLYADTLLHGTFSWTDYLKRRVIRIYPLTTVITMICIISNIGVFSYANIITHILLIHSWFPAYRMSINAPMWSLTIEESYYLIAPFLIYSCALISDAVFARLHTYTSIIKKYSIFFIMMIVLWIGSIAFSRGSVGLYQDMIMYWFGKWDKDALTMTIFGRMSDFVAGMLIATIARYFPPQKSKHGDIISSIGIILLIFSLQFIIMQGGPNSAGLNKMSVWAFAGIPLGASILFYGLHSGGLLNKILSSKLFILLGESSFALYVIQFIALPGIPNASMGLQMYIEAQNIHFLLAALISYMSFALIAFIVHIAFEKPITSYLRGKFIVNT
jgi:peptidoglycan/LPS O-acetylase OafA/YrhL